jgi:aromatic-L-amino-acid decarboxylase
MKAKLELSAEEMRSAGYLVVDRLVEHLVTLGAQRVGTKADPGNLPRFPRGAAPEEPAPFEEILSLVERHVLAYTMHVNHPRFFAYVPGPGNFIGALADALVSGFNVFSGTWISGSGPEAVERETIGWLRQWCGFPASAGGLFVSGGSMANLTALAAARQARIGFGNPRARVYLSTQAHASLEKGLRVLGFAPEQIAKLEVDGEYRLPAPAVARRVAADRGAGLLPFCVIASAGTTNTGAVDDLPGIARLCREQDLWFHIDGAYGAAAVLTGRRRQLLAGIELADSLSFDPHKWLFQPFECGCVLVREGRRLEQAFHIHADYMSDTRRDSEEFNYADLGIQLTRGFRALKLWMSVRTFGLAAFREAIEHGFEMAEFAAQQIQRMEGWELVTGPQMGIVCFRFQQDAEGLHERIVDELIAGGTALATTTTLAGRTVLRFCTINPRTSEDDIRLALAAMDAIARKLASGCAEV